MTHEIRDKWNGNSINERIRMYVAEAETDAVGLWQIIPYGREGFGLSGDALAKFVENCVAALLAAGAIPVKFGGDTGYAWVADYKFGRKKSEILPAAINEWRRIGEDKLELYGKAPWFAIPKLGSRLVKTD